MKLGLGTVQFGVDYGISNSSGRTTLNEVEKILKIAKAADINTIDTAAAYGNAEEVLGHFRLNDFNIVSKIPPIPHDQNTYDWAIDKFSQTRSNLAADHIYGLLLHDANDLHKHPIIRRVLTEQKTKEKVKKIGVSVYNPEQITENILDFIDLIQIPINIFDQRFIRSSSLERLKSNHIEIHARSTFLQGLLLMSQNAWPAYFNPIKKELTNFHNLANKLNTSPLSLALNYVLSIKQIDKVIVGVNNAAQLEEIITCIDNVDLKNIDFSEFNVSNENFINPSKWRLS